MSSLQQSIAKQKLGGLEPPPHPLSQSITPSANVEESKGSSEEEDDLKPLPESKASLEDDSSSASSASSVSSAGTIRPNEKKGRFTKGSNQRSVFHSSLAIESLC
jgi:hypothetical protein